MAGRYQIYIVATKGILKIEHNLGQLLYANNIFQTHSRVLAYLIVLAENAPQVAIGKENCP